MRAEHRAKKNSMEVFTIDTAWQVYGLLSAPREDYRQEKQYTYTRGREHTPHVLSSIGFAKRVDDSGGALFYWLA